MKNENEVTLEETQKLLDECFAKLPHHDLMMIKRDLQQQLADREKYGVPVLSILGQKFVCGNISLNEAVLLTDDNAKRIKKEIDDAAHARAMYYQKPYEEEGEKDER